MVANVRRYFNRRKVEASSIEAVIAKIPGPDELAPVNPFSRSYSKQTFPSPPSLQRLME